MEENLYLQHGEYFNPIADRLHNIENQISDLVEMKSGMQQMLYWWRGNGSPGARDLMQRLITEERVEEIVELTVHKVLKEERERNIDVRFRWFDIVVAAGVLFLAATEIIGRIQGVL